MVDMLDDDERLPLRRSRVRVPNMMPVWSVPVSMLSSSNKEPDAPMPAQTEFKVIKARDPEDLQMKVSGHLAEGYKLHGDTHYTKEFGLFVQAVIREP